MPAILHTADIHIDAGRHGKTPSGGVNTAWTSSAKVWSFICQTAIDRKVDALVVAGDLYNTGRPTPEAEAIVADELRKTAAAGITVILLMGNHELIRLKPGHRTALTVLGSIEGVEVVDSARLIDLGSVQIAAVPWPSKKEAILQNSDAASLPEQMNHLASVEALKTINSLAGQIDTNRPALLALHAPIAGAEIKRSSELILHPLFNEPVIPLENIDCAPWDYVAMGHLHERQLVGERCWYPGSPERLDFSEANDPKSINLVSFEDDGFVKVEHIPTPARKLAVIELAKFTKSLLEDGLTVKLLLKADEELPATIGDIFSEAGAFLASFQKAPKERPVLTQREKEIRSIATAAMPLTDALDMWFKFENIKKERASQLRGLAQDVANEVPTCS